MRFNKTILKKLFEILRFCIIKQDPKKRIRAFCICQGLDVKFQSSWQKAILSVKVQSERPNSNRKRCGWAWNLKIFYTKLRPRTTRKNLSNGRPKKDVMIPLIFNLTERLPIHVHQDYCFLVCVSVFVRVYITSITFQPTTICRFSQNLWLQINK